MLQASEQGSRHRSSDSLRSRQDLVERKKATYCFSMPVGLSSSRICVWSRFDLRSAELQIPQVGPAYCTDLPRAKIAQGQSTTDCDLTVQVSETTCLSLCTKTEDF